MDKSLTSFTPLHPESLGLQGLRMNGEIKFESTVKPHPLGRGVTGFTLVELCIVMMIIVAIISISLPGVNRIRANTNISKAKADLEMLKTAVESYMIHQDPAQYPNTTVQLWQDYLKDASPRIAEKALYDPFHSGNVEYRYVRSSNGAYYVIWSHGIDEISAITGIGDDGIITPADRGDDIYVSNGSTQ